MSNSSPLESPGQITAARPAPDLLAIERWESEGGRPLMFEEPLARPAPELLAVERWEDEGGSPPGLKECLSSPPDALSNDSG
ncbi:MAG: hypothetical protein B6A08_04255 [Sorangiineae bacterium NIC37A_2]|nr:MAG: hypothetical protein B6A08_04255 [Sorangiineae bacterium NIC37A_2]